MRILILLILLLTSAAAFSEEASNGSLIPIITGISNIEENRGNESYLSIGVFSTDSDNKIGALVPFGKFEAFYLDTGTDLFKNDFTGFAIGLGVYFDYFLSPYVQAGILAGENHICDNSDSSCTNDIVLGMYPEVGLMFYKKDFFVAQLFIKRYLLTEEAKSFTATGISFGISFKL